MQSVLLSIHPALTPAYLILFLVVALVIGMSKAGLNGISLSVIPVMALIFGARESTGIIVPMLITADIMAVIYYHRNAVWKYILRILPWIALGLLIAVITGNMINKNQFKIVLLTVVWAMLILMIVNDLRSNKRKDVPHNRVFASLMGTTGGFASMIGNSAGPVFTLYFLAMRLPKKEFIGTGAWVYLIMNTAKFPLHLFVWKTISIDTLALNLIAIPIIALGIYTGIIIVKLIPENVYRYFVIITTLAASVFLVI